jgi:aryl-alcohol dehydrogenase-like predicted oxidoreductase
MQYRTLGNTGMEVSVIGLGCAQLGSASTDYAVSIVQRALELGINYFDTARSYRDAEIKIGLALEGQRERALISSKTGARLRDDAWRELEESLQRLQTDYLDNWHMHGLNPGDDLDRRFGPGGALEALIEAREQGIVRHIGATSHHASVLVEALHRFDLEVILVPMNVVERQPPEALRPECRARGVGVTIMKPLATGLLPAPLALKWLANQPIHTAVPGTTTLEELEENAAVGALERFALTGDEAREVMALHESLEHVRCRVCSACQPACPQGIRIGTILGTDVMYDHYRTMGAEAFAAYAWSREALARDLPEREATIAAIASCTRCGACEAHCPYGLPIMEMLPQTLPVMRDMVRIYRELL